jgi:hypothetical protein
VTYGKVFEWDIKHKKGNKSSGKNLCRELSFIYFGVYDEIQEL